MSTLRRIADSDLLTWLAMNGHVFYASDSAQNTAVTGQTSFANTTPTFLLNVPSGTTAIPLHVKLQQSGTVAGGTIYVFMEIDDIAAYSSGGTAETILCARTDNPLSANSNFTNATLYSGATATAGYGVSLAHDVIVPDVTPLSSENLRPPWIWTPAAGLDFLVGPASWKVFTYAGTTGPTWWWSIKWAAFPTGMVTG